MDDLFLNATPYLLIMVFCIFWLLVRAAQRQDSEELNNQRSGPHASWRASEAAAPMRRLWHPRKDRR